MALVKYYEDNMEIALERFSNMEDRYRFNDYYPPDYLPSYRTSVSIRIETTPVMVSDNIEKKPKNDKAIRCKCCGKYFVFSVGEQLYYQKHQFDDPKKCKSCRELLKNSKKAS